MFNLRYSLLLTFVLLCGLCHAQKTISGTVFSKKTGKPLPFITMKLKAENVTSRAHENGAFNIYSVKNLPNDTLEFSGVGYLSVKIPVNDIKGELKVVLNEDVKRLKEVAILDRQDMILGKYKKSGFSPYLGTSLVTRRFQKPDDYSYLKRVVFWRKTDKMSRKGKTKFRLVVYNSESESGPPDDLVYNGEIEVEETGKAELVIDLSEYDILLPSNFFFIGVERITVPEAEKYEPKVYASKAEKHSWVKLFGDTAWKKIWITPAITATVM